MAGALESLTTLVSELDGVYASSQGTGAITAARVRQAMEDLIVSIYEAMTDQQSSSFTPPDTTDAGMLHEFTSASAVTWTIPPNSSVAYPVGTVVQGCQYGAGQVTIAPGAGVTIRTPSSLTSRAQYSTFGVRKRATDEWVAFGDLT